MGILFLIKRDGLIRKSGIVHFVKSFEKLRGLSGICFKIILERKKCGKIISRPPRGPGIGIVGCFMFTKFFSDLDAHWIFGFTFVKFQNLKKIFKRL